MAEVAASSRDAVGRILPGHVVDRPAKHVSRGRR
jgi:hypothetical protein